MLINLNQLRGVEKLASDHLRLVFSETHFLDIAGDAAPTLSGILRNYIVGLTEAPASEV